MKIRSLWTLLLLALPVAVAAQNSDMLTGRVVGTDGAPIVGARVTAMSIETEITRSVLSDKNGRYMIVFPDGGGRFVLRVSMIGLADVVKTVVREADEELLLANITMAPQAIQLEALEVTATRPPPGRGQTGEQSTQLPQEMLNRLPLPDLDPNTLALLAAGVIGTSLDSLSGRMGFSVAGMSDLLNQIMLDGVILGEGGLGVPEEGVRQTQVTTSTFDASRGGFAGGQVSMTSARGNNRTAGSLSYRLDNDALQFKATPTTNAFSRQNLGGSIGGPLIRNKLFGNTSFQLQRTVNHRFALAADDPLASLRSGVAVDSIARFLSILGGQYGFTTQGQTGPYDQLNNDLRMQGRLDWNITQGGTQSQTLSARFNLNLNDQDSTRIRELELLQHGGESERNNRLGALTLTSRFGTNWTNALNLSFSENWTDQLPYVELPEGRVRVTSQFEDGSFGTQTLVFGGNRSLPSEAYSRDLQISNDLSFLQPFGDQLHRLKVGGSLQRTRNIDRSSDNIFGSFTFNSLEDFEANLPTQYDRSLSERKTRTGTVNTGLYFGDTWRVSQPLEITLGLRWDRTVLDQRPDYNPAIEAAFGRRTDVEPVSSALSPRVGFSYRFGSTQPGQPAKALSGGIGLFAGRAPVNIFSTAIRQTGLPGSEQRLVCIGDAVPIPEWDRYLLDPTTVPDTCADGRPGVPDVFSSRAPTVTVVAPDQSMPSSLRLDLGYRTRLPRNLGANFRYTYSRGLGLWGYRDLNLDESRSFLLAGENRPFFGDASAIVSETGAVSQAGSRLDRDFASVYEVRSDRESEAHQFSAQVGGFLPWRITVSANYTLGFARDQGSGSFGQATTGANPNVAEWSTSGNDRRHNVNLTLSHAITPEIELSAIARLSSGSPFTPLVNRDVNGDGARNDRAFVFDPGAATDTAVVNGMTRLLAAVPDRIADCIQSQFGHIAERNSCRNPWAESLDLRAGFRPNLPNIGRRLTISLDGRNVLGGLDQLINGKDNMHGWGESARAESNLLEVRGFDPVSRSFRYQVNEGFGQTLRGPNAFRNAFSITLSGRLAVGGQAFQNNRGFGPPIALGAAGGGRGGFGGDGGRDGGGGRGGEFGGGFGDLMGMLRGANGQPLTTDSMIARVLANPIPVLLALGDSLGVNADQRTRLQAISDTLSAQFEKRRAALIKSTKGLEISALTGQGARQELRFDPQLIQRLQSDVLPHIEGSRREREQALKLAQAVLTPEQWQKLPATARAANAAQQGRRGFNAVGMLDRMLANPIPVLLSLKDTLKLSAEQVTQIQAISSGLDEKLTKRREELGKRLEGGVEGQQGQVFQQMQPEIQATRKEVMDALSAVEKVLTAEQWKQVPERVRNPFQNQGGPGGRRGQ